jgi:hypothetical protein
VARAELAADSGFGEPAPKPKPCHPREISDSTPNELLPISQSFPAYSAIDLGPGLSASPSMAELPPVEKGRPLSGLPARQDGSYSNTVAEVRKIAKYTLDVLLVAVPLVVVIYFVAYPDKFNAFLNWMVGR